MGDAATLRNRITAPKGAVKYRRSRVCEKNLLVIVEAQNFARIYIRHSKNLG